MNENSIPKWQREVSSFIGIKSGLLIEGNVYDEFPVFERDGDEISLLCTDGINQTLLSLLDAEKTCTVFFDPIDGFYCDEVGIDAQREMLTPFFDGYATVEKTVSHGCTLCLMPEGRKHGTPGSADDGKYILVSEIIRRAMANNDSFTSKENIVFVVNFASRLDACTLRESESNTMFLNLMASTTAVQASQTSCNTLVMVVDKYNDIPAWVYLNNPNIRTVSVCVPDRQVRKMYLEHLCDEMECYKSLSDDDNECGKKFIAETEGLQLQELRQILRLALKMNIPPESISEAFRLYKYGVLDDPWEKLDPNIINHIESKLEERVKGQGDALKKVKTVLTRAVKGLSGLQHSGASHKPRGILFFAGPTGVGKTETAKAIAESIFGDENACIRFDMSEYRLPESDQKLFGAPPGYVGYEGGGQLTNAVKNRPFSVILFDEIEKASPTILDKFLQILEDGRMTDNQGNTVYFGESIIIFTSNIGLTKEVADPENPFSTTRRRVPTVTIDDPMTPDTPEFREKVTHMLTEGVKDYFNNNGRPELLNRLGHDNIVVFQFINVEEAKLICDYKLKKICDAIFVDKGISIQTEEVKEMLHEKAVLARADGGRGVGNMLESEFLNPFSNFICEYDKMPSVLKCRNGENGIEFEVIENA